MDLHEERRLVRCCQKGDRNALESLMTAYRDGSYRLAYRFTGSHADTDDVLQEAWLRVYRGIEQFDGRARFGTWLRTILLNVAVDHQRRRSRRVETERLSAARDSQTTGASSDPSQMAAAGELKEALHEAMQALSVEQRSALVLVAFEGLSYADAAEIQQCPTGTLAWRVAEARRQLAEKLGPHLERTGGGDHAM